MLSVLNTLKMQIRTLVQGLLLGKTCVALQRLHFCTAHFSYNGNVVLPANLCGTLRSSRYNPCNTQGVK